MDRCAKCRIESGDDSSLKASADPRHPVTSGKGTLTGSRCGLTPGDIIRLQQQT